MDYPKEFSPKAQAAIEGAKIRAGIDLNQEGQVTYYGFPTQDQMTAYIMTVVLAFGREACELGRSERKTVVGSGMWTTEPAWSVVRIESETRQFLGTFAVDAYKEKSPDGILVNESGQIIQSIWNGFIASPEWEQFEESRLEIANIQAGLPFDSRDIPIRPIGIYRSPTAREIEKLRIEAKLTQEQLAGLVKCDPTTVYRHESGSTTPQPWRVSTYERIFSNVLKRDVVITVTPIKRK